MEDQEHERFDRLKRQEQEYFDLLKQGAAAWNRWKRKQVELAAVLEGDKHWETDWSDPINISFSEFDFSFAELSEVDLSNTDLSGAYLWDADLSSPFARSVQRRKARC